MPRNGSGTYVPPVNSWNQALTGPATAADWQALLNDIVASITQSISKDGQTPITSPITFDDVTVVDFTYSGALIGGTGSINIGSGQIVKDTAGNLGLGVTPSAATTKTLQSQFGMFAGNEQFNGLCNAFFDSATYRYIGNGFSTRISLNRSNGNLTIDQAVSGIAGDPITFIDIARFNNNGFFKASNTGGYGSVAGASDLTATLGHVIQSDQNNATLTLLTSSTGGSVSNALSRLPTGAAGLHFQGILNTTSVYQVLANGDVRNTNNSYGAISDAKLKEKIVDAPSYIEKFMQVRFRNYNMIGSDLKQFGVIAQELESVFPGLVESTVDLDEEGNEIGSYTKSVKYSVLAQIQGKVIQEQQQIIQAQQAQIESILARLDALESN